MDEDRVAIVDLADELQLRKQRLFKLLKRLGIALIQRRDDERRGQNVSVVTVVEAATIRAELARLTSTGPDGAELFVLADDGGFFSLIRHEPDHDPGRFKVRFTIELDGRLQKRRCSAPFAEYVKTWPSRRVWERAAIDSVTDGCKRLHTEVFRAASIETVQRRAEAFFSVMPNIRSELGSESEEGDSEANNTASTPTEVRPVG